MTVATLNTFPSVKRGATFLLLVLGTVAIGAACSLGLYASAARWVVWATLGIAWIAAGLMIRNWRLYLLCTLVISLPLNLQTRIYQKTDGVFGVFFTAADACLLGLLLLLCLDFLSVRGKRVLVFGRILAPLVALLGTGLLSLSVCVSKAGVAYHLIYLMKLVLLIFLVSNSVRSVHECRVVAWSLFAAMAFGSALLLIQVTLGIAFTATGQLSEMGGEGTIVKAGGGTFSSANDAAKFLAPPLLAAMAMLLCIRRQPLQRALLLGAVGIGTLGLVRTLSRGGWLAFACGFVVLLMLAVKRKMVSVSGLVLIAIVCLVLGLVSYSTIQWRLEESDIDNKAALTRVPLMYQALEIFIDNPVLGVGPGNYENVMWRYSVEGYESFWRRQVHNGYLIVLVEYGIPGLMAFSWLLFAFWAESSRCFHSNNRTVNALGLGGMCFLAAQCVHMTLEWWSPHEPCAIAFCVMLALLAAARFHTLTEDGKQVSLWGSQIIPGGAACYWPSTRLRPIMAPGDRP